MAQLKMSNRVTRVTLKNIFEHYNFDIEKDGTPRIRDGFQVFNKGKLLFTFDNIELIIFSEFIVRVNLNSIEQILFYKNKDSIQVEILIKKSNENLKMVMEI
jgi:hypothetical protein